MAPRDDTGQGGQGGFGPVQLGLNASLRLAVREVEQGKDGVAQRAIDHALTWSDLLVPAPGGPPTDQFIERADSGERVLVAFTHEAALWRWTEDEQLVCTLESGVSVAGRICGSDLAGMALNPSSGGGVIVPRSDLSALEAGTASREASAGDNVALRLAVDVARQEADALAREALYESLAHAGALVPARSWVEPVDVHSLRHPTDPATGKPVLAAFTDRRALSEGPSKASGEAVLLDGQALVRIVADHDFDALVLNPGQAGAVVIPRAEVLELAQRLEHGSQRMTT